MGGRQDPSLHTTLARDLFANSKKNYIKVLSPVAWATGPLSPLGRATGGHFRNFSKRTYIFEIFIFFNIKKEKTPIYDMFILFSKDVCSFYCQHAVC